MQAIPQYPFSCDSGGHRVSGVELGTRRSVQHFPDFLKLDVTTGPGTGSFPPFWSAGMWTWCEDSISWQSNKMEGAWVLDMVKLPHQPWDMDVQAVIWEKTSLSFLKASYLVVFKFNFLFYIGVWLVYNVVLASGSSKVIQICVCIYLFQILFPCRLLQNIE